MITVQAAQQLHQAYKASPIYANNQLRFAYNGRGETIGDYLKAFPQAETTLRNVDSISKLNLWVFKNAEKYARFAQHSNPASTIDDIKYWFRGQIGEWFILDIFLQDQSVFKKYRFKRQYSVGHAFAQIHGMLSLFDIRMVRPRKRQQLLHKPAHLLRHGLDGREKAAAVRLAAGAGLQELSIRQDHGQGCFELMGGI